jgi:hypothetical protein
LEPYKCVAFVDCRLRRSGLTICERLHVHWILSTWPSTLREACWQSRTVEVSHLSSGGVADRKLQISKWTPMTDPQIHSRPQMVRVPRDASTILDAAMFARGSRRAPVARRLFPVRSLNLGSAQDPIWHSGGLLPAQCDRRTRVLTPCIGLPLPLWGLRRMSQAELLQALDFSDACVSGIGRTPTLLPPSFWTRCLPGKCLAAAFECFSAPAQFSGINGGGWEI